MVIAMTTALLGRRLKIDDPGREGTIRFVGHGGRPDAGGNRIVCVAFDDRTGDRLLLPPGLGATETSAGGVTLLD
jgi:hypothetical protein